MVAISATGGQSCKGISGASGPKHPSEAAVMQAVVERTVEHSCPEEQRKQDHSIVHCWE